VSISKKALGRVHGNLTVMRLNSSEVRDDQNIPLTHSFKLFELEDHLEKASMTRGLEQTAYADKQCEL
jgi:hypothetical protein